MLVFAGDHHQDGQADGRAGGPGRQRRLASEMEAKAHDAFPSGDQMFGCALTSAVHLNKSTHRGLVGANGLWLLAKLRACIKMSLFQK